MITLYQVFERKGDLFSNLKKRGRETGSLTFLAFSDLTKRDIQWSGRSGIIKMSDRFVTKRE